MRKIRMAVIAGIMVSLAAGAMYSTAQNRGPGNFDPERMREMMAQRMQERLEISAEEWKVIGPLFQSVMEKQRAVGSGGMGMMGLMMRRPGGGPGGPGAGPGGDRGGRGRNPFGGEPDPAAEALQQTLDKSDVSSDEIKSKLAAFRTSRDKKAAELKTAREELRKVLTLKQEALLVLTGTLD